MDVVDVLSPSELEVRRYFGRLKAAAAVYNQIAKTNISRAQAEQNAQLNDGSRVRTYTVGDNVSIYFPKKSLEWMEAEAYAAMAWTHGYYKPSLSNFLCNEGYGY